ncbi:GNAT family N-acetyltransferase [Streptomyces sp. LP05-1]|uniref:GNAT family N-acetyltransferase n=1 Tax=Streptomyces pyxinae TaxID=2970734 RepID=A0ABT2CDP7_9ACTN|nr:GNAT family N-acetyltransferase [Streptomyces sp. LP05-1]MCS0635538.1 GNAT family N-acetyltransferase [Streptomyces sp. LP05-1]
MTGDEPTPAPASLPPAPARRLPAPAVRVRRIQEGDWSAITALEAAAYTPLGLSEGEQRLRSRAAVSPETCSVLHLGDRLAGYLLSLPCPPFRCPDLDRAEQPSAPGPHAGNLHLHDLVIARELRRQGLAQRLIRHLRRTAGSLGYERISLVAVGGADPFWAARGFTAHPGVRPPAGYGDQAVYMSQRLEAS